MSTIWLILMAASFGAVVDRHAGADHEADRGVARGRSSLVLVTMLSSIGLNGFMADPYGSGILGSRMLEGEYEERRMSRTTLAATLASSGSAISHIIRWNLMGAVLSTTLGLTMGDFRLHHEPGRAHPRSPNDCAACLTAATADGCRSSGAP